jgi:hypothetical protein
MRVTPTLFAALVVAVLGWGQIQAQSCGPWIPRPRPTLQDQAQFLGSEDYFQAHGGNPRDYVTALFGGVLGRAPTANEMQRWCERYTTCGNCVVMAREFLVFAQSELAAQAAAAPPPPPTPIVIQPVIQVPYLPPAVQPFPVFLPR